MAEALALQSDLYFENWSVIRTLDDLLWMTKFMPPGGFLLHGREVKVTFFGAAGANKILNALQRIFGKVKTAEL